MLRTIKYKQVQTSPTRFNKIQTCIETVPSKTKRKGQNNKPYINKSLLEIRTLVEKSRKKFLKKRTENNEKQYKELKKDYNYKLRKARNDYYANKLQRENKDSKKIWATINEVLNRTKNQEQITEIEYDNKVIKDEKTIANIFSEYYKEAAYERVKKIDKKNEFTNYLQKNDKQTAKFKLKKITKADTWKYIKTMKPKTSSGTDQIPVK